MYNSSSLSRRKLIPLVPDVPYHIQLLFLFVMGYIWRTALSDDYLSPYPQDPEEAEKITKQNWWRSVIACTLLLCSFSYLRPDQLDIFNPCQRFWRVYTMLSLIYFCLILVLMNHRPSYGRWLLGFFDSRLNQKITKGQHTYDDDCEVTLKNIWDNFDHYYLVHLGDWFLASFVIRDPILLYMWSIMDEVIELSWQHILPHFRECWWDHIFHDVLLSNTPAIIFGLWVQRKMKLKKYDFFFRYDKRGQLLPFSEWEVWHCHRKFGILCYIQAFLTFHFLSGFFINNNLLIPPVHPFPVIRLLLWFALGAISFRESYDDARSWHTVKRFNQNVSGRFRWLGVALITSEMVMCYKYRFDTGHINSEAITPFYIWFPWTASIVFMACKWINLRFKTGHTTKYPIDECRRIKIN